MSASNLIIPPYLQPGDTIGLVCPAGYMAAERTEVCVRVLQGWGYRVRTGDTVGHQHHYFSGTDAERLADLQRMLDDPEVRAVLCARGGYGTTRYIDDIDWTAFRQHPKWIIGFSDVTALHCHLQAQLQTASLHAPMAGAFNDANGEDIYVQSLRRALAGDQLAYQSAPHPFNRFGEAAGPLIGGNLCLLAHLSGTLSEPDTRGCILFLEDVGEYLYNIDRMMVQLSRSGKLRHVAAVLFGGFSDCKDTTIPFGKTVDEILLAHVSRLDVPVAFGFPVSHQHENFALRSGMQHRLIIDETGALLISEP